MGYVIIGNSAAGNAAAQVIRQQQPQAEITVLSEEAEPAYYRPLLPLFLSGERPREDLFWEPRHLPQGVNLRLGERAISLDPEKKALLLASGERLPYDKLLLATGALPLRLRVPGAAGPGVFYFRRLKDAAALKEATEKGRKAVVIGGGRVGTKMALALRHLGREVALVEKLPRLIPLQLDETASRIFEAAFRKEGIELILGQGLLQVRRHPAGVAGVVLEDGKFLESDLIVAAVGVEADVDLARRAGIRVERGIVVDSLLHTSHPDIYAGGDAVETVDVVSGEKIVSGLWTNAVSMGRIAGENMTGGQRKYPGAFSVLNAMELAGIAVISVGIIDPPPGKGFQVYASQRDNFYRKLIFQQDILRGLLLVGEIEKAGVYTTLIREGVALGALQEEVFSPRFSYAKYTHLRAPLLDTYIVG